MHNRRVNFSGQPPIRNRANLLYVLSYPPDLCPQVVTALLKERADNGRGSGSGSGSGKTMTPAWSRTRSADSASAGPGKQRITNRYVPPAARQYSSPVAATAEAPGSGDGEDSDGGGGAFRPWRRRTSTWSGLSEERGPDVGEDGRATGDDADALVAGGGFAAVLRAGRRASTGAEGSAGGRGGAGAGATNGGVSGGLLSRADFDDTHPDVFSVGDDWGGLSFDGSQHTTTVGTNRADA